MPLGIAFAEETLQTQITIIKSVEFQLLQIYNWNIVMTFYILCSCLAEQILQLIARDAPRWY